MSIRTYIFGMKISQQDLAWGKNPPLCDSCNTPFVMNEFFIFEVQALVLNSSIWGLICHDCRQKFTKIRTVEGDAIPKKALRALHDVLGRSARIIAL